MSKGLEWIFPNSLAYFIFFSKQHISDIEKKKHQRIKDRIWNIGPESTVLLNLF